VLREAYSRGTLQQGKSGERFVQYRVIGTNDVAVRTHFFIVLRLEQESSFVEEFAYVMPNKQIARETPLEAFQTIVGKIEKVFGIIFRPSLGS
jgi:DNA/RNA endonuclease G (NUC1)